MAQQAERPRLTSGVHGLPQTELGSALRTRLTWLLLFRAAVVTVLLVTSLVLRATSPEPLFANAAVALYGIAALSYVSILFGGIWMRLRGDRGIRLLAMSQLGFDAVTATAVIMITGGVESVFVFIYSLTVLNASAVVGRAGAWSLAAVAAALYAVMLVLESVGLFVPLGADHAAHFAELVVPFLTNTASFVLVAILAGFLTEQLQKTSERLDVAHAHIETLEQVTAAVLDSLPSGVISVDEGLHVVYANAAATDMVSSPRGSMLGRNLADVVPEFVAEVRKGEQPRFEHKAQVAKRGARIFGGSVARLSGLSGVAGRVIVFQDLTELRRLQEGRAQAERLAELGRFAAGLAHEVRNPLAAMIGCLQLLETDIAKIGDDGAKMLDIARREAERLSGLVTDFLRYARPSPPQLIQTDLRVVVTETCTAVQQGLNERVELTVHGQHPVHARFDPDQLRQVLWNLIVNAEQALLAQATPQAALNIAVEVTADDGDALIVVEDNGPGVPDDARERIFEPFFTTRAAGTGLGLATSRQVVVQHHGTLTVTAGRQAGARFEIRIPMDATAA